MQNNILGQHSVHTVKPKNFALTKLSSTGEEYTRVSKMHYSLKATMGEDLVDASTDFVSPVRNFCGSPLTYPCSGRHFLRSVPPINDLHLSEHQLTEPF